MPPRKAPSTNGSANRKNAATKSSTPSVLHFFGGESSSKPPVDPTTTSFEITSTNGKPIKCEQYTPKSQSGSKSTYDTTSSKGAVATPGLIFTHGAGGGLSNPATSCFAIGAAVTAPSLVFEGAFNLVARTKQYQAVLQHVLDSRSEDDGSNLVPALGGRSLGARAAVQTVNARNAATSSTSQSFTTLVLVSYPLTGPSGDTRDAILCDIEPNVDVLFVSGDRDGMCDLEKLNGVRKRMRAHSWLAVVRGADHGMSVKPASSVEARRKATGALAARWLASRDRNRTECVLVGTETEEWVAAKGEKGPADAMKRKMDEKAEGKTKKAQKVR